MNKVISYLLLICAIAISGCSAKESDIIGDWCGSYESSDKQILVIVRFSSDHTGTIVAYKDSYARGAFGQNNDVATVADFKWEIDDYLIRISGEYATNFQTDPQSFSCDFRYSNNTLTTENVLCGYTFPLTSKMVLYK